MIPSFLLSFVRGLVMGAADIVPGVSGGTVALVFGIYDRLIASVKAGSSALGNALKFNKEGFKRWITTVDWAFITALGFGILVAVAVLAPVLDSLLETEAVPMSALFLGLVAGSVVIAWQLLKEPKLRHVALVVGIGVAVFIGLGVTGGTTSDAVIQLLDPSPLAFFAAGAVAISAMILPGVSGSFLLVLLGMYEPLLSAVTDRDFATLGVFLLGTIVGLALFSQILYKALTLYHDVVIAMLVGLMAGSLRVLWPWPNGVFSTALGRPDEDVLLSVVIASVAAILVIVVARFAQRLEALDHPAPDDV